MAEPGDWEFWLRGTGGSKLRSESMFRLPPLYAGLTGLAGLRTGSGGILDPRRGMQGEGEGGGEGGHWPFRTSLL